MTELTEVLADETLRHALGRTSTPEERLWGLGRLKFGTADLARALGVTQQTIRAWTKDASGIRTDSRDILDELRLAVLTLLEGGLNALEVQPWFTSKPGRAPRPIDLIRTDPDAVLVAVEAELNERPQEVRRILEEGSTPQELTTVATPRDGAENPARTKHPARKG